MALIPDTGAMRQLQDGYVYFIAPEALLHREEDTALVKIGFTRGSPKKRLQSLQTGSPLHLKVWAYIEGSEALERALHETFVELASHGEWFTVANKLFDFMTYLGEEPNVGNLVSRERVCDAIHDCLFPDQPSHPSLDADLWQLSANPDCLRQFFPEVFTWH